MKNPLSKFFFICAVFFLLMGCIDLYYTIQATDVFWNIILCRGTAKIVMGFFLLVFSKI
jgi:hypothetical protein